MSIILKLLIPLLFLTNSADIYCSSSTKNTMNKVLESYINLIPYMYKYKESLTKSEHEKIYSHILDLEIAFKKTKHNLSLKDNRFIPSLEITRSAIKEIKDSYEVKNYEFSKLRLRKLNSACISCHSQLPLKTYSSIRTQKAMAAIQNITSNYEKGMYFYFLRDYRKAIEFFKIDLSQSDSKNIRNNKLIKEILKIYIVNLNQLKEAREFLKSVHAKSSLHKVWLNDIAKWESLDKQMNLKDQIKSFLVPIENELVNGNANSSMIDLFSLERSFSIYLEENHQGLKEAYYWIGLIRNNFYEIYLYSLGEAHLKQCIKSFKKSNIAKKCFKAYEKSIINGFSGSSGTNIPKKIKTELSELKKMI